MRGFVYVWRQAVMGSTLPASARHVAFALSTYMSNDEAVAWPSVATLATDTGLSVSTVRRHLRRLEAGGWLHVQPSKGGRPAKDHHRTNTWRAAMPPAPEPAR